MEKPDEEDDYLLNSWLGLNALNVMIQQQVLVHMSDKTGCNVVAHMARVGRVHPKQLTHHICARHCIFKVNAAH